jgi:hypothetical protein
VSSGRAVFKECIIVYKKYETIGTKMCQKKLTVVPDVMVNNLAVLTTLIALNKPIWCDPLSNPAVASTKDTQKLTMATKSILLQLCLKYGTFRCVLSWAWITLSRNGKARLSLPRSERKAVEKNVGWAVL